MSKTIRRKPMATRVGDRKQQNRLRDRMLELITQRELLERDHTATDVRYHDYYDTICVWAERMGLERPWSPDFVNEWVSGLDETVVPVVPHELVHALGTMRMLEEKRDELHDAMKAAARELLEVQRQMHTR